MSTVPEGPSVDTAWKALRFFGYYRLVVAGLFATLAVTGRLMAPLGGADPALFRGGAIGYAGLALCALVLVRLRWPGYRAQVFGQVLLDILAITLLMFASGGVTSGMGMLLVVAIAGASILTAGRTAILYAAIASLAVLLEEGYAWVNQVVEAAQYTHAGLLGIAFFATALLAHVLARRIRESEALAAQRGVDLENLARLNETIVQRMQSGIVVLDAARRVRLMNDSAKRLLGLGPGVRPEGAAIGPLAPGLDRHLASWADARDATPAILQAPEDGAETLVSMTALGDGAAGGVLVFLEDASVMRQRAQQLKLASLGRLTASIAHEVRNPLGAIRHAGQLLGEEPALSSDGQRLTRIIRDQSDRVNAIIENVMRLSRRDASEPVSLPLGPWLAAFASEFAASHGLPEDELRVTVDPDDLAVRMDPTQLHQVLRNLCENAVRHGEGSPLVELRAGFGADLDRPWLDIVNPGRPLPDDVADQIFEPFFTTEPEGTGLGLYIARELCESNQASLQLQRGFTDGVWFRITFAHPERHQLNIA